jgi:hypothetical protein
MTREREIVQLRAGGKSTKEVAITLGISAKTAETHRANQMFEDGKRIFRFDTFGDEAFWGKEIIVTESVRTLDVPRPTMNRHILQVFT